ncbi:hypothetical protein SSBR45G_04230 [Bradyrhizobium sp. SSBR45G]|uniref:hypothetical protein n=1 Tax=unclassified Bradyrhizobium TaxID=2631580 RepID=UPI002342AA0E|nr:MULTISPECIES: hypothetical protein [unclassified Bradyrhizobium]GLH75515.1 hypothetical protein SSBR45G_04230 [Bradyrhizobium sp. SSBR45G]GLH82698.1 hypothetical protein SSBR45R_01580 [Bradyrhizobium sp. SSBR45R]
MQSTQNVQQIDPSEIGLAPEKPEKAGYDQLYRRVLREVLTRIDTRLAAIEKPGVAADAAAAASTGHAAGHEGGRWARIKAPLGKLRGRNAVGLALLVVLVGGSVAWSQREAGTSLMDRWMPGSSETSQEEASAQPGNEDAMMSNASLRGTEDGATPAAPGTLMQRMARDIAELQQGIEQIKSTQDQASRDHTRAIEQLQAGQDQLMRLVSRMSNQAAQARGATGAPTPPQQIIVTPQPRTTTGLARNQPQQQGSTIGTFLTRNTSGIQSPLPR